MRDAVIVDAVRAPIGRRKGTLKGVHPVDLSASVLTALAARNQLDPELIEDIVWGCVTQIAEQSTNVGRLAVLAAKAILLAALVLAAGAVAVFGSVLAGHLILPGHGFTAARGFHQVWLSYGPTLRAVCGSVLYLGLIALMSLGVAVIVRDPAVSIGVVLALLYLFPIVLAFVGNAHWQHRLERWTPTIAGLTIQATTGLRSLAISPWGGLGVLGIWAAAALVLGALAFRLRDA